MIDELTVEITTAEPEAQLPYQLAMVVMSSPAQWLALGKSWDNFIKKPSGTGPFKMETYVPRERAVLARNEAYWNKNRVPKLDKLVLLPVPDPSARVAALRSSQVDWVEAPPPDAVDSLKGAGFAVVSNVYPQLLPWHFSRLELSLIHI